MITTVLATLLHFQAAGDEVLPTDAQWRAAENIRRQLSNPFAKAVLCSNYGQALPSSDTRTLEFKLSKEVSVSLDSLGELMGVYRREAFSLPPRMSQAVEDKEAKQAYALYLPAWVKERMGIQGGRWVQSGSPMIFKGSGNFTRLYSFYWTMMVEGLPVSKTQVELTFNAFDASWKISRNWTKVPREFIRGRRFSEEEAITMTALATMPTMGDGFYVAEGSSSWRQYKGKQYSSTIIFIGSALHKPDTVDANYVARYTGNAEILRVNNSISMLNTLRHEFTKEELNGMAADVLKRGCRVVFPDELEKAKKPSPLGPGLDVKVIGSFATPALDTSSLKRVIVFARDRRTYLIGYYERENNAIRCKIQGKDYAWKVDPDWFN